MTKDKFRELCEQVLIPRLGDFLHQQLSGRDDTLDVLARELMRIGARLDRIAALLSEGHADQGQ